MHRILLAALCPLVAGAQDAAFERVVRPFVASHCAVCHNEKLKTGNLDLAAARTPEVWNKVHEKLTTGKMPPPGQPRPPEAEIARVAAAIDDLLRRTGFARASDPGRVTARRLNRVEYDNTVRDLLGVDMRASADFPVDDSGYGFDNIGDVLTVSPMLMEKYMAAARRISRAAVFGERVPAKPTVLARLMARRSYDGGSVLGADYLPYSMRGALYGSWRFPVDAEYELRFRVMNLRNETSAQPGDRGERLRAASGASAAERLKAYLERERQAAPPLKLVLTVDGETRLTGVIEGNTDFAYDRGEFVARVALTAGEHFLRASFPELADLDDPRKHLNPDRRRKVFVDYLDIVGPHNRSPAPPASYRRVFVCGHAPGGHQAACTAAILRDVARRAYRRPPSQGEIEGLERLAKMVREDGESFEESIRIALQAILVSPHFLFRVEREPAGGPRPVGEFELASRLSYFLWASMPDDELLRAAGAGTLSRPEVLDAQVRRMLADPRSRSLVDDFAWQWLQLRDLERRRPSPQHFPALDDELLDAMLHETRLFAGAIVREDRSILEFLDAPFTYLNGPLARHYGIAGAGGEEFRRVALEGERRGGLLAQGATLTVSSYPTRTSPVIRGKWVLENLLGAPPPPPPPDVPELEEAKIGVTASLREQLEQHRARPACAVCHTQMDAIGFALENYDATGAWRTHEGRFPIDASGSFSDGRSFRGPRELTRVLLENSDVFTRNLTEKLLTYALGRGLEPFDREAVDGIAQEVRAGGHRFSALVRGIVNSKPFRMRGPEGGGP
jgi:hypothetical protein